MTTTVLQTWTKNSVHRPAIEAFLASKPIAAAKHLSIAEELSQIEGAITAEKLARILGVSKVTVFKLAKAGRLPSFRVGSCVRFDPRAVAKWLRER